MPFLRSIGIAGMLIPLVSVAVAITLLPVVLATIGPRLDRRTRGATTTPAAAGRPGRASSFATAGPPPAPRRPSWPRLVVAASTIQLGDPQAESLAQSGPARAGARQLERSGVGTGPLSPFDTLVRSGDPGAVATSSRGRRRPERRRARDWRATRRR